MVEELCDTMPTTNPMRHVIHELPGVALYPADTWEREGWSPMALKGWCKLCRRVVHKDMNNLGTVFEIAQVCDSAFGGERRD